MMYDARYCLKCKTRSFCSDSCVNFNSHSCFSTDTARAKQIKITALCKLLTESVKFRDMYKNLNKQNRVKRRGQKHLFRLNIDDTSRICDIVQDPDSYCDQTSVSIMNETVGAVHTLLSDWNDIMCMIMYKAEYIILIRLIPVTRVTQ